MASVKFNKVMHPYTSRPNQKANSIMYFSVLRCQAKLRVISLTPASGKRIMAFPRFLLMCIFVAVVVVVVVVVVVFVDILGAKSEAGRDCVGE